MTASCHTFPESVTLVARPDITHSVAVVALAPASFTVAAARIAVSFVWMLTAVRWIRTLGADGIGDLQRACQSIDISYGAGKCITCTKAYMSILA